MKTCTYIAISDSLNAHIQAVDPIEAEDRGINNARFQRRHTNHVQADSLPPAPHELKPLPANLPLTSKPLMVENDFWEDPLAHIEKSSFVQRADSVIGVRDTTLADAKLFGFAGDPTPYQFRNDSMVTIVVMVSFFLMAWVVSRSRHYLHEQIKDFFHHRKRENLFAQRTQNELRGQVFLVFQTCFLLGILFFDYTQEFMQQVFNQVSPYKTLGLSVGICCTYYLLKVGVYAFINNIFFDRRQCTQWMESYMLCVLGMGVALLPVSLLVVYFDLSMQNTAICFLCILAIDKMLLFYKCFRIFFGYKLGWVHLFLYFCTLEIAPIFILFRALVYASNFLLTIN